ncbi:MAG: hypothetical protein LBV12_12925 [Puniceicoccales bacterium]|jgi:pimeloyl-ACP methyl ester carboxylesterase|nr:hypothetical protein [Puniceicoccales bacterium]
MKAILVFIFTIIVLPGCLVGLRAEKSDVNTLRLQPASGMVRAELKYFDPPAQCAGALVLCPGYNQDGEFLIRQKEWQDLAQKHRLILVGLSFASKEEDLGASERRGYYYVERGSGEILLAELEKITSRDLSIVIFGHSGGAHFAHRFVYQFPDRVRAWGAYGFGWHDEAPAASKAKPPGVFICGLKDERLGSTREAFLSGLRSQWPVCWLGVPGSGHVIDSKASVWVRSYFDAILSQPSNAPGVWSKASDRGLEGFLVRCWFPNEKIKKSWEQFP